MPAVSGRSAAAAAVVDVACVALLVVIGTRNHDTDTGAGAVFGVAVPFLVALAVGWLAARAWRDPLSPRTAATVWGSTVVLGMVLRNVAFDRGTAPAFVIVASLFLAGTMWGWRAVAARRTRVAQA